MHTRTLSLAIFLTIAYALFLSPLRSKADTNSDPDLKELNVFGTAEKELSVLKPRVEAGRFGTT